MTDQATSREAWPGEPFPLGATWDGEGTNFSLFSEHAVQVELCLFDEQGNEELIDVAERTAHNWHCYLPGVGPGQRYGYRVYGRYAPEEGQRFNPTKLLGLISVLAAMAIALNEIVRRLELHYSRWRTD